MERITFIENSFSKLQTSFLSTAQPSHLISSYRLQKYRHVYGYVLPFTFSSVETILLSYLRNGIVFSVFLIFVDWSNSGTFWEVL